MKFISIHPPIPSRPRNVAQYRANADRLAREIAHNSRLTRQLNDEISAHHQTRLALDRVKRQATRNGWVAVGATAALLIQTLILLRPYRTI